MKKRDTFYITILFILPILFVLCVSTYSMYGSKLDWLSQHISLADYFRQTQQLLPDSFENLQGQTNAFSFSYSSVSAFSACSIFDVEGINPSKSLRLDISNVVLAVG